MSTEAASTATTAPAATTTGKTHKSDATCDYLLSDRGCVKGASCDFVHPTAPNGTVTNRVCSFFGSGRGCTKAGACPYLHAIRYAPNGETSTRVCDFYLTSQGCVKGMSCNFLHPKAVPAKFNLLEQGRGLHSIGVNNNTSGRECKFVSSPEGCRKGADCPFTHPGQPTRATNTSGRAPNVLRGGVASRGLSIVPSIQKRAKPCQYFGTAEGCKKGDLCEFVHMRNKTCAYFAQGTCKKGAVCDFIHTK